MSDPRPTSSNRTERFEFESLLLELSSAFVNIAPERVNDEIKRQLKRLVEFLELDRSTFFEYSEKEQRIFVTHSHAAGDVEPFEETIESGRLSWAEERLFRGELFLFSSPDELPESAEEEKRYFSERGILSLVAVPLKLGGNFLGVYSVTSLQRRQKWSPEWIRRLRIIGSIFANALSRKRMNEELRDSETRWRSLIENAPDVIVVADRQGIIRFVNRTMSGAPVENAVGKNIYDYITPDDRNRVKGIIGEVLRTGEPTKYYTKAFTGDGIWGWYESSVGAIKRDGRIESIILITHDITKRVETELALKESEATLRALLDAPRESALLLNLDLTVKAINQTAAERLGVTRDQVIGMDIRELLPADVVASREKYARKALREKRPVRVFDERDGIHFDTTYNPVFDDCGEVTSMAVFATDVTEQKKIEIALEESQRFAEGVLQSSPGLVFIFDLDQRRAVYANRMIPHLLGYTEEETERMKGGLYADILHPSDLNRLPETFENLSSIKEGETVSVEFRIRAKSGRWHHFFTTAAAYQRDDEGKVRQIVCTAIDITEMKETESALRQSQAQLKAVVESLPFDLWMRNKDEVCILQNNVARQLWGDQIGKTPEHLGVSDSLLEDWTTKKTIVLRGGVIDEEMEISAKGKRGVYCSIMAPVKTDDEVIGVLGLNIDITEQKKSETRLRRALAEIEELKERLLQENIYLRDEIEVDHNFENIITGNETFRSILNTVGRVAQTDTSVLIMGETGTGKELVARAIHKLSPRGEYPLVRVNCAALPANLIESELFGHEKGAFTGALSRKVGRFELAHKSTIFLDEVGDLPLELQAKLLRVLQEGEFERVGGTETKKVDVRVVAATNRDLQKAIREGKFREDLYYRLSVFPITIPPLRERPEDIPLLAAHFVKKYSSAIGRKINRIPKRILKALSSYHWPGNVRELENVIERGVILSEGSTLQIEDLQVKTQRADRSREKNSTLAELERDHILQTLKKCNWIIEGSRGAARMLDIPPSTLRDRMKKLGLKRPY
jgi:PAS domain S-box-containing protein